MGGCVVGWLIGGWWLGGWCLGWWELGVVVVGGWVVVRGSGGLVRGLGGGCWWVCFDTLNKHMLSICSTCPCLEYRNIPGGVLRLKNIVSFK